MLAIRKKSQSARHVQLNNNNGITYLWLESSRWRPTLWLCETARVFGYFSL